MQKKHGQKAEAMNSAELAALLDQVVLNQVLLRRMANAGIEVGSKAFDDRCKEFANAIGVPDLWFHIFYPFAISADNCKKHPWARRLLLRPRLNAADWQALETELQAAEDDFVLDQGRELVQQALGTAACDISDEELDALAVLELQSKPEVRCRCLKEYRELHGLPYKMHVLRRMMIKKPWLRIVLPHQWMPLCALAPDIHQVIEHRVGEVKVDCSNSAWKLLKDGGSPRLLLLAHTYQQMILKSAELRSTEKGKEAIKQSIRHMLQLCKILKAEKGELVQVQLLRKRSDGSVVLKYEEHFGTAGGWGPSKLS